MPYITLSYPKNCEGSTTTPTVALELSFFDRMQDWFNYHFRLEHANAIGVHRDMWCKGVAEEVQFWDAFLATRGGDWNEDYLQRINPALPLQSDLEQLIKAAQGSTVRILDVGAGPFTFIGRKSPHWPIEIIAVDPLADVYDRLLRKHGITPPVRTLRLAAEDVRKAFARNTFDIACARNSLDHALDPLSAIEQMLAVVKPGGALYLSHHLNEAEHNAYSGLHQWNFDLQDGNFIISSQMTRRNVTAMLRKQASVHSEIWQERGWLTTTIVKHG